MTTASQHLAETIHGAMFVYFDKQLNVIHAAVSHSTVHVVNMWGDVVATYGSAGIKNAEIAAFIVNEATTEERRAFVREEATANGYSLSE